MGITIVLKERPNWYDYYFIWKAFSFLGWYFNFGVFFFTNLFGNKND
jgi:hypothetical protein